MPKKNIKNIQQKNLQLLWVKNKTIYFAVGLKDTYIFL